MRVPRSQRGGEVVEPLVRKQWFVRMKPLAAPALQVSLVAILHAPGGLWRHCTLHGGLAALHAHFGSGACVAWVAGSSKGGLPLPLAGHAGICVFRCWRCGLRVACCTAQ